MSTREPDQTGDDPQHEQELAALLEESPASGPLAPGLYVVSTPIGAARDITLRAIDILRQADLLLAEDTRTLRRLMEIHAIKLGGRPLWPYHDHNGAQMRPKVLEALAAGRSVALVSDAGTPLVADPGYQLVRTVSEAGYTLRAAPGASAILTALAVAGLPTDRFAFMGFPPSSGSGRGRFLADAAGMSMTCVLYESPHRIHRLLEDLSHICAPEREIVLCRELTKKFEEVIRTDIAGLIAALGGRELKGELVAILAGRSEAVSAEDSEARLDAALRQALSKARLRQAVDLVAIELGLPRRDVYQRALALKEAEGSSGEE